MARQVRQQMSGYMCALRTRQTRGEEVGAAEKIGTESCAARI